LANDAGDVISNVTDVDVTRETVTLCGLPGGSTTTNATYAHSDF